MKFFSILPLLLIIVSVDAIGFRLDPRGSVSSSSLVVTRMAVTEIMHLKDEFIREVGQYVQHLRHHGRFSDFAHKGLTYTASLLFTPDPGFRQDDLSDSNLIFGVNELYDWVETEFGRNTLSTEGALILLTDCGRAIGTFEYFFHQTRPHGELKRKMAINKTLPQMSWTTGVAKAKATNIAKANTKSRDSILTGGLPPLVYMPNITLPTSFSSPDKNDVSLAAELCKRSDYGEFMKKNYICRGVDTLLSGLILYRGQSLWNEKGARLHVQDDGNLCLWHYPGGKPTTYWCWNHGIKLSQHLLIELMNNGRICLFNGPITNGAAYCTNNPSGPNDGQYRLTLQNDGNLVLYRGVYEKVMFSTNSAIFPYTGPTPCTARPINY